MRIAVDALSARVGGGVTYLHHMFRCLREIDQENEYWVFVTEQNRQIVLPFGDPRFHPVIVNVRNIAHRLLYEQIVIPVFLARVRADVVYAPAEVAPLMSPVPVVVALRNPNVYDRPDVTWPLRERARFGVLQFLARLSVRKAHRVIFVSDTSRSQISHLLGIPAEKTQTIYHGVDERWLNGSSQPSPSDPPGRVPHEPYVLYVSSTDPHKNHATLIDAYAGLPRSLRRTLKLVLVGTKVRPNFDALVQQVKRSGLDEEVHFTGEIPHEHLYAVYRRAALFVFPSLRETFGIPLVEAMACGCPIVASTAGAIPEIVGDAAILVDAVDPRMIRDAMERVLTDVNLREALIARSRVRARDYSWKRSARLLRETLERCAQRG